MNARDRYVNHTYTENRDHGRAEHAAQGRITEAARASPLTGTARADSLS